MSLATLDLPSDVDAPRALTVALQASLATTETELATTTVELATSAAELRIARASIQLTALEIAKLKAQIAKLKRMQFGQSSERLDRVIDQLELRLEELETQEGAEISASTAAGVPEPETRRARRLPPRRAAAPPRYRPCRAQRRRLCLRRQDDPAWRERHRVLEYVPGRFEVVRRVRPKLACQRCDAIS